MEVKWLIKGEKEKIRPALEEWVNEFTNYMIECSQKKVKTPLGVMDFPIFTVSYEEAKDGFIYKQNLPIPSVGGLVKGIMWVQFRRAKSQLKKYFESKGIKVEIKDAK